MAKQKSTGAASEASAATVGHEDQLWQMTFALRGSIDAAEYNHVVLRPDAFEEQQAKLLDDRKSGADLEEPDEYRALSTFWVPPEARWQHVKAQARQPAIGQLVDSAMAGIERDNPALKGVLPKDYARPALDKQRLGQLIDLISNIRVGDDEVCAKDELGRAYEYSSSRSSRAPRASRARVLHPALRGQAAGRDARALPRPSVRPLLRLFGHVRAVGGVHPRAYQGKWAKPGPTSESTNTFHNDRRPDLKADFIRADPSFNVSDWGGERLRDDKRWQYGASPKGNANFLQARIA